MNERMTVQQLASLWNRSTRHVYRLIQSGKLVAIDIGTGDSKSYLISKDAVLAFEQSRTRKPSPSKSRYPATSRWLS